MTERLEFSIQEREQALALYQELKEKVGSSLEPGDDSSMRHHLMQAIELHQVRRDVFGLNPIVSSLQTALLVVDEIGLRRDAVMAIMLRPSVENGALSIEEVSATYGESVARILHGLRHQREQFLFVFFLHGGLLQILRKILSQWAKKYLPMSSGTMPNSSQMESISR